MYNMELKEIRLRLRKTQCDIAKILEVSQSYVAGLEKGVYKPSEEMEDLIKDLESDAVYMPDLDDKPIQRHFSLGVVDQSDIDKFNYLKGDMPNRAFFKELLNEYKGDI